MLGHKLWQTLAGRCDAYVTLRQSPGAYTRFGIFDLSRAASHVSVEDFDSVVRVFASVHPEVVVNCVGIVKQDAAAKDALLNISVNALFPHRLAQLCQAAGARLIHMSTDCVFSGRKGHYAEGDAADAEDLYGRTKLLGEVDGGGCLTLRTSMIGRELQGSHGLIEWFLSQQGRKVRGFRRAVFSGFTTDALSQIIADIIEARHDLEGVYHVAAAPITKFDLLSLVREVYGLDIEIEPEETFVCDRSLNDERFRCATGFVPPSWREMIEGMRADATPYEEIRGTQARK